MPARGCCGIVGGVTANQKPQKSRDRRRELLSSASRSRSHPTSKPLSPDPSCCQAITQSGERCHAKPVKGLTVCAKHGGNTASSRRKSRISRAKDQSYKLWGISEEATDHELKSELHNLLESKLQDATAIRVHLSREKNAVGLMLDEVSDSSESYREVERLRVHPLVKELHSVEKDIVDIIKVLHSMNPEVVDENTKKMISMQASRKAARILKAYPGISVDSVALQVAKDQLG